MAWTFRHSPATGAVFAVHVAVADSVNDQHDHEFWMKMDTLAVKARCTRGTAGKAMSWLEDHGLVELLSERNGGRSMPSRYRFLYPEVEVVYDTRKVRAERAVTATDTARSGRESARSTSAKVRAERARKEPKDSTQENPSSDAVASRTPVSWEIPKLVLDSGHLDAAIALCMKLAGQLAERGYVKPENITTTACSKRWVLDMEQLLRLDGRDPHHVGVVLDWLHSGRDEVASFWRTNVRSPAKLRDKWVTMGEQYERTVKPKARRPNVVPGGALSTDELMRRAYGRDSAAGPPASSALSLPSGAAKEVSA